MAESKGFESLWKCLNPLKNKGIYTCDSKFIVITAIRRTQT